MDGLGRAVAGAVGSEPATAGKAALQVAGPSLGRPCPGASASRGAESRGRGAGERRRPRLQRDPPPAERRGRPVSPGEPAALERRELSSTSTKRKGNQPALTCKQGLPSGGARSDSPPSALTCTPIRLQPIHLPSPGPSRRGTRAGGGCSSRPRRLRPPVRKSRPPGECPAPGSRRPTCPVGVVDPEVSGPGLGSAPEVPRFRADPRPQPGPQRVGRGRAQLWDKGCGGDRCLW